jgi:hypothetical protein
MTYATSKLHGPLHIGLGMRFWALDTVDIVTDVDAAGFISDAKERGMYKGDFVFVRVWTTAIPTETSEMLTAAGVANVIADYAMMVVMGISTAGAADLSNETAITITNSD